MKRKRIVRPEIPQGDHAGGDEFGGIEFDAEAFGEQVNDAVVDAQTDQGGQQEFGELGNHCGVLAVESPHAVEQVVAHDRTEKSGAVGDVFVEPYFFLAEPGNAEIDRYPGCTDDAEFEKFDD